MPAQKTPYPQKGKFQLQLHSETHSRMLELPETLSVEQVAAAKETTRVPAVIEDVPLSDRASEAFQKYKEK